MPTISPPSAPEPDVATTGSRRGLWLVAGLLAVVLLVVLMVFQPQRLLFDTVVDEPFPSVQAPPPAVEQTDEAAEPADANAAEPAEDATANDEDDAADEVATPAEPVRTSTGSFSSRHRYEVQGDASVYELPDGGSVLRLEDGFASTNGPQLHVYLVAAGADADDAAFATDAIDLGPLRGNVGAQNYPIPEDVDLAVYDTVVIWCVPFSRGFGAAELRTP